MTVYSKLNSRATRNVSHSKLSPAEQELKVLLLGKKGGKGAEAPKLPAFQNRVARIAKDPKFAFMLTHVGAYTGLGSGEGGAFYRYVKCPTCKAGGVCDGKNPCWAHFGYGRSVVDTRREKMKELKLIATYPGGGNRTYWRADYAAVVMWLDEHDPMGWESPEVRERALALARGDANLQSGSCDTDTPECGEPAFQSVENQHSQYRGNPKETTEETAESKGDDSHLVNDFEVHEEPHDRNGKVVTSPRVEEIPEPPEHVTPTWRDEPFPLEKVLAHFDEWFEEYDVAPLSKYERRRYGWEIVSIVEEYGADYDTLDNVILRVIRRTGAVEKPHRLTPTEAYQDEVSGERMPPAPVLPPKPHPSRRN